MASAGTGPSPGATVAWHPTGHQSSQAVVLTTLANDIRILVWATAAGTQDWAPQGWVEAPQVSKQDPRGDDCCPPEMALALGVGGVGEALCWASENGTAGKPTPGHPGPCSASVRSLPIPKPHLRPQAAQRWTRSPGPGLEDPSSSGPARSARMGEGHLTQAWEGGMWGGSPEPEEEGRGLGWARRSGPGETPSHPSPRGS